MRFYTTAIRFEFGLIPQHELPEHAIAALEHGIDSPTLRVLAALSCMPYDPWEVQAAYRQVLHELEIELPPPDAIALILIEDELRAIASGSIDALSGAHHIYNLYHRSNWSMRSKHYVGDAIGISRLYGLIDCCDELPGGPAYDQTMAELKNEIRVEASHLLTCQPWRPTGAA